MRVLAPSSHLMRVLPAIKLLFIISSKHFLLHLFAICRSRPPLKNRIRAVHASIRQYPTLF
jgi:hypothetical protein